MSTEIRNPFAASVLFLRDDDVPLVAKTVECPVLFFPYRLEDYLQMGRIFQQSSFPFQVQQPLL